MKCQGVWGWGENEGSGRVLGKSDELVGSWGEHKAVGEGLRKWLTPLSAIAPS